MVAALLEALLGLVDLAGLISVWPVICFLVVNLALMAGIYWLVPDPGLRQFLSIAAFVMTTSASIVRMRRRK